MKSCYLLVVLLAVVLSGAGCEGIYVKDAGTKYAIQPYETKLQPVKVKAKPVETKREFVPEKIQIIPKIPAGNYPKLELGKPITVARLQEEIRRTGQTPYVSKKELCLEVKGDDGKWYRCRAEPGTIFLAERSQAARGVKEFTLVKVALNQKPVRGVVVRELPAVTKVTKLYQETVTKPFVERYRDIKKTIDFTPALWFGLGGLLIGGVGVWLIGRFISPIKKKGKPR